MSTARRAAAACMIAGPLTLAASVAVSPRIVSSAREQVAVIAAQPTRQYVSSVLALVALALLFGAVVGLAGAASARAPRAALLGAALSFIGLVATAASTGLALIEWQMTRDGLPRNQMVVLLDSIYHSPGLQAVFYSSAALALGLALLALAALRAGAAPVSAALAIAAGALGVDAGFALNSLALASAAAATLAAGFGAAGVVALRREL